MKKEPEAVRQIRARWLDEHLKKVDRMAGQWLGELILANPFYPPDREEDWGRAYEPPAEGDPEKNHVIRKHLQSRTLWTYHARWRQLLEAFTGLRKAVLEEARSLAPGKGQYWVFTALWQAWEWARSEPKSEDEEKDWERRISSYYRPDSPPSPAVMFGGFAIEEKGEVGRVRGAHMEMIKSLARLDSLKEALGVWSEIEVLGKQMGEIGRRIVKSHDILYPCQYCRHLWK